MYAPKRPNYSRFSTSVRHTNPKKKILFFFSFGQIAQRLHDAYSVVLEADSWSDRYTKSRYPGVIAHTVKGRDCEFEFSFVLPFPSSEATESVEYMADTILQATEKAKQSFRDIVCVVTVGDSPMKKISEKFGFPRVECLAYVLDNIFKSTVKNIPFIREIYDRTRSTVAHFRQSPKNLERLISIQRQMGIADIGLRSSVGMGFNSFLLVLQQLQSSSGAISAWIEKNPKSPNRATVGLTSLQLDIIRLIKDYLAVLSRFSDDMKDENDGQDASGVSARTTMLHRGIAFINDLLMAGFILAFDSWTDLGQDCNQIIDLDASTGGEKESTQNPELFAAIFMLELAIRMRHYWLTRILVDLHANHNHSIDAIFVMIHWKKNEDFYEQLEAMLLSRHACPQEIKEFSKVLQNTSDKCDTSTENTFESDDLVKSFFHDWKDFNLGDLLKCLKIVRKGVMEDGETIYSLANEHVERAYDWYWSSPSETTAPNRVSPPVIDLTDRESNDNAGNMPEDDHGDAKETKNEKRAKKKNKNASCATPPKSTTPSPKKIVELNVGKLFRVVLVAKAAPCTSTKAPRCVPVANIGFHPRNSSLIFEELEKEVQIIANSRLMPKPQFFEALNWDYAEFASTRSRKLNVGRSQSEFLDDGYISDDMDWLRPSTLAEKGSQTQASDSTSPAASVQSPPAQDDEEDHKIQSAASDTPNKARPTTQSKKRKNSAATPKPLPRKQKAPLTSKKHSSLPK